MLEHFEIKPSRAKSRRGVYPRRFNLPKEVHDLFVFERVQLLLAQFKTSLVPDCVGHFREIETVIEDPDAE